MKSSTKSLALICASVFLLSSQCSKQDEPVIFEDSSAYVNFNLGEAPTSTAGRQELSLYGCDTVVSTRDVYWNGEANLEWDVDNQVLSHVPYGYQEKDGKRFFISKYYMASPPVMNGGEGSDQKAIIGQVIPDQFTLFGERPVQMVHLNYNILEPVYLNYVNVDFNHLSFENNMTCSDQQVNFVSINIQCKDFRWENLLSSGSMIGAKGASGIGRLRNEAGQNQVFLPSYDADAKECLDCTITVLDDILLDHEVFFVTDDGWFKTISLTDFYQRYGQGKSIGLACRPRFELPEGCKPPREY